MMRQLHAAFNWVRQMVFRRRIEREMQGEMYAHIEQQAELNRARGMSTRDAMAEARREFGNVPYLQEQSRDARGTRFVQETMGDVRYGIRSLFRTPGYSLVAILSLTLGIGVNTALFTFLQYLWSQPVVDPATYATFRLPITYPAWQAITREPNLFSSTIGYHNAPVAVRRDGQSPLKADAQLVSDGFFRMYGIQPLHGRVLVAGEADNAGGVSPAVLSHAFWMHHFGGDSTAIGRNLRLSNGSSFTIVGVARADAHGTSRRMPDFWLPFSARQELPSFRTPETAVDWLNDPDRAWITLGARLAEGTSIDQARMRVRHVLQNLNTADTARIESFDRFFASGEDMAFGMSWDKAGGLGLMFAATFMVLLIGCANVANLVLARGVRRRREIAVRQSLGASRTRLIRQLMTESAILAVVGAILALVLSTTLIRIIGSSNWLQEVLQGAGTIGMERVKPEVSTVAFTFVAAIISAVGCGLLPALRSTKLDLSSATRDDGAAVGHRLSRSKLRTGLVVSQVALCLVLLVCASVLVRSAQNASSMDLGFDRTHLVSMSPSVGETGYTNAQHIEFGRNYQQRVEALLGAPNVARGSIPTQPGSYVRVHPQQAGRVTATTIAASPTYFSVLGIPVVRGRGFTELEARNGSPVVVVSEKTAKSIWPNADALGQRLLIADEEYAGQRDSLVNKREVLVIGVARDAQITSLGYTPLRLFYVPTDTGNFLMRVRDAESSISVLRDAARITDPNVLTTVRTVEDILNSGRVLGARLTAGNSGGLGALALVLSVLGIFGVVAYAVSQRTREIGVRLAIGAQPRDVLRMVIRQGMRAVLLGAVIGVVLAALATRALRVMLFGISAVDPVAYAAAIGAVCLAALLACYFPARRATRIDPVGALRSE